MTRALLRATLIFLATGAGYGGSLLAISFFHDLQQPLAVGWTFAWLEGAVFAGLNTWRFWGRWRDVVRSGEPRATVVAAEWIFRWTAMSLLACVLMAAAGYSALTGIGSQEMRVVALFAAGLCVVANQVLNTLEDERHGIALKGG